MRVLCYDVSKRLAVLVFTEMDDRPHAPSPESSLYWFRKGTLKNPPTSRKEKGTLKNPPTSRKEKGTQLPFLWSGLVIVYKSLKILHKYFLYREVAQLRKRKKKKHFLKVTGTSE